MSRKLELVRSIYADRERGDFGRADWAAPKIEIVTIDGPEPSSATGLMALQRFMRIWLSAWTDVHSEAEDCRDRADLGLAE
jgi:hypothetical protein